MRHDIVRHPYFLQHPTQELYSNFGLDKVLRECAQSWDRLKHLIDGTPPHIPPTPIVTHGRSKCILVAQMRPLPKVLFGCLCAHSMVHQQSHLLHAYSRLVSPGHIRPYLGRTPAWANTDTPMSSTSTIHWPDAFLIGHHWPPCVHALCWPLPG